MRDQYGVAPAAALRAAAHRFLPHRESRGTKSSRERVILAGRPDSEDAAGLQRGFRDRDSVFAIQPGVRRCGERGGAVVDIEQHRIERARDSRAGPGTSPTSTRTRGSSSGRSASAPSSPRFQSTTAGISSATTTVAPAGRMSSAARSVNPCRGRRRARRARRASARAAAERRERLLRAVQPARHQALAVRENQVFTRMTDERQLRPIGRLPPVENCPGLHEVTQRARNPFRKVLVRKGDSNPHDLAAASPSSWCVCQFRHFRSEGCQGPYRGCRDVPTKLPFYHIPRAVTFGRCGVRR